MDKMKKRKIFILLPAYNEESALPILIPKINEAIRDVKENYQICVCDDGSSDRTLSIAEELSKTYPIMIIQHPINRGLGETIRDLMELAASLASPDDVIVRLDCDDTHDPSVITRMIDRLSDGYDVVVASRFEKGGGQRGLNAYRTFISLLASVFMKVFFGIKGVRDYSCAFRAYRAEIIQKAIRVFGNDFVQLKGLGFTVSVEKLVKLKILGAKFSEVGFVLRYDNKVGASKMVTSLTTFGYFTLALLYHWPWGGWRYGDWKDPSE